MNVNFNHAAAYSVSLFKESILSTLMQKKVLIVAAAAFALLAVLYAAGCCSFHVSVSTHSSDSDNPHENLQQKAKQTSDRAFVDGDLKNRTVTYGNGTVENGEFVKGVLHGQAKRSYRSGLQEEGQFKNGKLNGEGSRTLPSGITEHGEFKDGKLNGQGLKAYPNGKVDEGLFHHGVLVTPISKSIPKMKVAAAEEKKENPLPESPELPKKLELKQEDLKTLLEQSPTREKIPNRVPTEKVAPKIEVDPRAEKLQQLAILKENIREALKRDDIRVATLEKWIADYSSTSMSVHVEYLSLYEEILKTFAAKLHQACDSKEAWQKLMPVVTGVNWVMQSWNPMEEPETKALRDRVIKSRTELLTIDIHLKRIFAEWEGAEIVYSMALRNAQMLLAQGSESARKIATKMLDEETAKRDQKIHAIKTKIEDIKTQLMDLQK